MKITQQAIKTIQKKILLDETEIPFTDMGNLGLGTKEEQFEFANIRLERKQFREIYRISIIDKNKDLDGVPIGESKKLFNKLLELWESKTEEITSDEFKELNINPSLLTMTIKNFELSSKLFSDSYYISLIDKERDPAGRWSDESTTVDNVFKEIELFGLSSSSRTTEKALETELYKHLKEKFHTVDRQVYIGGVKALKIDIDVANGKIGVELKMAHKLIDSTEKQRFIGQMHDYTTKRYKPENFILAVAGGQMQKDDITLREIRKLVQEKSRFCYIQID